MASLSPWEEKSLNEKISTLASFENLRGIRNTLRPLVQNHLPITPPQGKPLGSGQIQFLREIEGAAVLDGEGTLQREGPAELFRLREGSAGQEDDGDSLPSQELEPGKGLPKILTPFGEKSPVKIRKNEKRKHHKREYTTLLLFKL